MTTTCSTHEATARTAKVVALAAALERLLPGTTPAERALVARANTPEMWEAVADLAGCRPPSITTVAWLVRALERQQPPVADPFEGL